MQPPSTTMTRTAAAVGGHGNLPAIQFLRGFAAVLVVLCHGSLMSSRYFGRDFLGNVFSAGGLGVDLFFVLSGFIITHVHRRDLGRPDRFAPFWIKRVSRIYPMYLLVTLAMAPAYFGLIHVGGDTFDGDWAYVARSVLLLPQNQLPILSVGWTLTHELFFYLLFSLLILSNSRWTRVLIAVIAAGSLIKLFADLGAHWDGKYITGATPMDASFLTAFAFSRCNIEFLLGALVGVLASRGGWRAPAWSLWLGVALFVAPMMLNAFGPYDLHRLVGSRPEAVLYFGPVSAFLIYCAASWVSKPLTGALPRVAAYLGDASYSIYLIHYPTLLGVFVVLKRFHPATPLAAGLLAGGAVILAIAVGCMLYGFIETRLNRKVRHGLTNLVQPTEQLQPAR